MKDGGAFDLPAPEARREMLAEEVDLVARQDRLLKMALSAAAALSLATLARNRRYWTRMIGLKRVVTSPHKAKTPAKACSVG